MTMLILVCSCSSSVLAYGWPFADSCIGEDQVSLLLANWGIGDEWGEGDLDDNGTVNDADLSLLLANWGCPPIMGDVNLNGLVDDDDLSILLAHWNQYDVGWTEGDLNGDGYVDDDDLSLFTAPPWPWPGDPPAPEAIPEPATVALLAVGGLALIRRRR